MIKEKGNLMLIWFVANEKKIIIKAHSEFYVFQNARKKEGVVVKSDIFTWKYMYCVII